MSFSASVHSDKSESVLQGLVLIAAMNGPTIVKTAVTRLEANGGEVRPAPIAPSVLMFHVTGFRASAIEELTGGS
ncbi:hypothetical protein [Synechococcus sp. MEDNS5]|uniref:hypothetical protein n=1 Tax=Synechococcus sp. MEDNS5 TaxID=1442554 RepID=UPI001644D5CA|nr:hypothetical protein [Synechococcus sp. MEDNS5]